MAVKLFLKQKEEGLSYQQNPAYIYIYFFKKPLTIS